MYYIYERSLKGGNMRLFVWVCVRVFICVSMWSDDTRRHTLIVLFCHNDPPTPSHLMTLC